MDAWTFVNKEARFVNKPLKIILLVLAALVLLVVGYLAYVLIDYHRLGDMDLEVDRAGASARRDRPGISPAVL